MKIEPIKVPMSQGRRVVDIDDEDLLEDDEEIMRVPRSGKRRIMPIDRLRK